MIKNKTQIIFLIIQLRIKQTKLKIYIYYYIFNLLRCSNYHTIAFISHASKVMLKILQARLQQYVNRELPDVQAGFRKGRGTGDQMTTSAGSWKKQESSRKTSISTSLTMPKPLTVWIIINCGKLLKRWDYQTPLPVFWETCMWVKKKQSEPCMVQDWERSTTGLSAVTCSFNLYTEHNI